MPMATGATGAATPAVAVVILAGVVARLALAVKVKVPVPPAEIFCTRSTVRVLVKVQTNFAPPTTFAPGRVMVRVAAAKLPSGVAGLPEMAELRSVQLPAVVCQPAGGAVSCTKTALVKDET